MVDEIDSGNFNRVDMQLRLNSTAAVSASPPTVTWIGQLRGTCSPLFGGGEGIRTPDPLLAKQVLSRLSYTPTYSVCDYSRVALTDARSHGERMGFRLRENDGLIPDGIATLRSQRQFCTMLSFYIAGGSGYDTPTNLR